MKIPLFDIDYTLLQGGNPVHSSAFDYALHTVYNIPNATKKEITGNGMIDPQIILEIVKLHGLSENEALPLLPQAMQAMELYFDKHYREGVYNLLPGVLELLHLIANHGIPIGVLSGNCKRIAMRKLHESGIDTFFSFGSYGNGHLKRSDLVPAAFATFQQTDYGKQHLSIEQSDFIILGDSVRDIECAQAAGLDIVAVATGNTPFDTLQSLQPTLIVHSLEEFSPIVSLIR